MVFGLDPAVPRQNLIRSKNGLISLFLSRASQYHTQIKLGAPTMLASAYLSRIGVRSAGWKTEGVGRYEVDAREKVPLIG